MFSFSRCDIKKIAEKPTNLSFRFLLVDKSKSLVMASIRSYIEQQLTEIELLRCCYPSTDEFYLDDIDAFNEAKQFIDGKQDHLQRNLSFILKLHLNDIHVKKDAILHCKTTGVLIL